MTKFMTQLNTFFIELSSKGEDYASFGFCCGFGFWRGLGCVAGLGIGGPGMGIGIGNTSRTAALGAA